MYKFSIRVTQSGKETTLPLSVAPESVYMGGKWFAGLDMPDSTAALIADMGLWNELPTYAYAEGCATAGQFEDEEGNAVASWVLLLDGQIAPFAAFEAALSDF